MTSPDVPILLIGFNRPDYLRRIIDVVRPLQPRRVFLAVDGPRDGVAGDQSAVQRTRDQAAAIDWPCEMQTLFRDRNLGCGLSVSQAVTWFLDQVESGIILEDDVAPVPAFFDYCAEMLSRYADDSRVCAVSGTNFVPAAFQEDPERARFSQIPVVWGWATWRRAWDRYRLDIAGWRRELPAQQLRARVGGNRWAALRWRANFDLMARKAIDTWDIQLVFAAMRDGALTVTPPWNLVENFGWGPTATHTHRRPGYLREVQNRPVAPPDAVRVDERADAWLMEHVYAGSLPGLLGEGWRGLRSRIGVN